MDLSLSEDCETQPDMQSGSRRIPVFALRHGQSMHNVAYHNRPNRDVYFDDPNIWDSPLTLKGHRDALEVGSLDRNSPNCWTRIGEVTIVLVSPLARTLQTASNMWKIAIEEAGFVFPVWNSAAVEIDGQAWVVDSEEAFEESRKKGRQMAAQPMSADSRSLDTDYGHRLSLDSSCTSDFLSPGTDWGMDIAPLRRRLKVRFVALDQLREYALGMKVNERKSRRQLEKLFPWVDFSYLLSDTDCLGPATIDEKENYEFLGAKGEEAPSFDETSNGLWWQTDGGYKCETIRTFRRRVTDFKRLMLDRSVLEGSEEQRCLSVNLRDFDSPGVAPDTLIGIDSSSARTEFTGFTLTRFHDLFDAIHAPQEQIALVSHSGFLGQMCFNVFGNEKRPLRYVYPYQYVIQSVEQSSDVPEEDWEKQKF